MRWLRRSPWIVVVVATIAAATVAMAASLSLTSANLTIYRTCVITANPTTSTAESDAMVLEDDATGNYGTSNTMEVSSDQTNGANHRSYLRFDLTKCSPAIASTANVKIATLRVYASTIPGACRTQDLFRTTAAWTETGAGSITWSNQPFGTTLNNPPQAQRSAFVTVGTGACTYNAVGYAAWTVTADVQAWVSGTTNNGWMIRDDVEDSSTPRTVIYSTNNLNTLSQAPQLVVNYS
jgi:hypothetical protein